VRSTGSSPWTGEEFGERSFAWVSWNPGARIPIGHGSLEVVEVQGSPRRSSSTHGSSPRNESVGAPRYTYASPWPSTGGDDDPGSGGRRGGREATWGGLPAGRPLKRPSFSALGRVVAELTDDELVQIVADRLDAREGS
jgi:hypothetical protein